MITTESFFERPRSWSLIKYKILDYYLSQYFPKVNQQYKAPAYVADLFAGRGKFEDGSVGSPLIIARHAYKYQQLLGFRNRVILSEIIEEDRKVLLNNMEEYIQNKVVTVIPGEATDVGKFLLAEIPASRPLFIFLDPFGIKGLSMELLLQVFERAKRGSTELLINFNYRAVQRLSGICKNLASKSDTLRKQALTIKSIVDDSLNGDWWFKIMTSESIPEDKKLDTIMENYLNNFRSVFQWIGLVPVTSFRDKKDIKYYLIFASQSQIAIELMNDVTIRARKEALLDEIKEENIDTLFQGNNPNEFIKNTSQKDIEGLSEIIFKETLIMVNQGIGTSEKITDVSFTRPDIRARLLKWQFARFTKSEYNDAIKKLLIDGKFVSENNSIQISDERKIKIIHS